MYRKKRADLKAVLYLILAENLAMLGKLVVNIKKQVFRLIRIEKRTNKSS